MTDMHRTIEAVWKIESTRLIGTIARITYDIGIAEELAQDALVTALALWPEEGIPENPGAWLMSTAKNRAIDTLRLASTTPSTRPDASKAPLSTARAAITTARAASDPPSDESVTCRTAAVATTCASSAFRTWYFPIYAPCSKRGSLPSVP